MEYHRNLTHSVLVAFLLLVILAIVEAIASSNKKRHENLLYEIETASLDDDALLALSGALSSQESYIGINFKRTPPPPLPLSPLFYFLSFGSSSFFQFP